MIEKSDPFSKRHQINGTLQALPRGLPPKGLADISKLVPKFPLYPTHPLKKPTLKQPPTGMYARLCHSALLRDYKQTNKQTNKKGT